MFEKIVVVDSTGLNTWGVERLKELGKEVVFYTGIPETDEEIVCSSLIIHRSGGT